MAVAREHCIYTFNHLRNKETLFNYIHALFHPYLAISSTFLIVMAKKEKEFFFWQVVDMYFEMVESGPMGHGAPLKKS